MRWSSVTAALLFCSPLAAADELQPISIAEVKRDAPVDFGKDILPILRSHCLACHNATDAESDLVLETPQSIVKGGASGPALVAKQSVESLLLKLAAHQNEPAMPPPDNDRGAQPLSPDELGLIKLWIDEGATGDISTAEAPIQWQPLPANVNSILATAITANGRYAACGRANQLFVYDLLASRLAQKLVDPALTSHDANSPAEIAHLDLIQSLAFNPDEDLLASGEFRTVKLWRRQRNVRLADWIMEGPGASLAVSPDSRMAVTGQTDGNIHVWDLATGRLVERLAGHTGAVTSLALTPDAKVLYSGSADGTVRAWDLSTMALRHTLTTPAPVHAVALLADGSQIVTGHADHVIRIWAMPQPAAPDQAPASGATGNPPPATLVREFQGHGRAVTSLAVLRSAPTQFISGSLDGTLRHWESSDGREIRQLVHGGAVAAVHARPDGARFVSAGEDHVSKLWNAADGQLVATFQGDQQTHARLARAERALVLAQGHQTDRQQTLEAAEKGAQERADALNKAKEAQAAAEQAQTDKTQTAAQLAAEKESADKAVAETADLFKKADEAKSAAEQAAKLAQEAVGRADAELRKATELASKDAQAGSEAVAILAAAQQALQDATTRHKTLDDLLLGKLNEERAAAEQRATVAKTAAETVAKKAQESQDAAKQAETAKVAAQHATEDAQRNATQAAEAAATAKDERTKAEQAFQEATAAQGTAQAASTASQHAFQSAAFSDDNLQLAFGDASGMVHLYDATTGTADDTLRGHTAPVLALVFTADGSLVSVGNDARLIRWDTSPPWTLERTMGRVDDASQFADRVLALDFSPDGKLLATGGGQPSRNGQLKIWNVADGTLVREIKDAHSDTVFALKFSEDGQYLASSAADRMVKLFRVADGGLVRAFEGHTHHVLGVSWKADGKWLASCGADNAIKVWDVATGEQARTIQGYQKEVTAISFLGLSEQALSCSGDKTIRLHSAANGQQVRALEGAGEYVVSLAATLDGKRVVAGGLDSVLRVWSSDSGQLQSSFGPP